MKRSRPLQCLIGTVFAALGLLPALAAAQGVRTLSKERLSSSPRAIVVDVRQPLHWESSDAQIAGALREDPEKVDAWASKYKGPAPIVLYCA